MQEQLDKEQAVRRDHEMTRMYELLDAKLITYRDISEDTCMLIDEKTYSFSKGVRYLIYTNRLTALGLDTLEHRRLQQDLLHTLSLIHISEPTRPY